MPPVGSSRRGRQRGPCAACGSAASSRWRRFGEERAAKAIEVLRNGIWRPSSEFADVDPSDPNSDFCGDLSCLYYAVERRQVMLRKAETTTCSKGAKKVGRFPTTRSEIDLLVKNIVIDGTVLDCCGGSRDSICLYFKMTCSVISNDISHRREADFNLDASQDEFWDKLRETKGEVDWVVSSPPFQLTQCSSIVRRCLDARPKCGVAMRLRLGFLEAAGPRKWLREQPPSGIIVIPRRSNDRNGLPFLSFDFCSQGWLVWFTDPTRSSELFRGAPPAQFVVS